MRGIDLVVAATGTATVAGLERTAAKLTLTPSSGSEYDDFHSGGVHKGFASGGCLKEFRPADGLSHARRLTPAPGPASTAPSTALPAPALWLGMFWQAATADIASAADKGDVERLLPPPPPPPPPPPRNGGNAGNRPDSRVIPCGAANTGECATTATSGGDSDDGGTRSASQSGKRCLRSVVC